MTKAEGDGIIGLLRGWESFEDLLPKTEDGRTIGCTLLPPPTLVLSVYSENGWQGNIEFRKRNDCNTDEPRLGVSFPGVWQLRVPDEAAGALMSLFDAWEAADRKDFEAEVLVVRSGRTDPRHDGGTDVRSARGG